MEYEVLTKYNLENEGDSARNWMRMIREKDWVMCGEQFVVRCEAIRSKVGVKTGQVRRTMTSDEVWIGC